MKGKQLDAEKGGLTPDKGLVPKKRNQRQNEPKNEPDVEESDVYAIRKNVPMPKQGKRKGIVDAFPLEAMAVKDSFVTKIPYTKAAQNKLGGMMRQFVKKRKIKMIFSARKDEMSEFLAVWRVR